MKLIEEKLSRKEIYDGKLLHLVVDDVRLPNGEVASREFCLHVGAVCIIPILPDGEVIVERQFRYPHGRIFLEIPAGKLDFAEEDISSAAARELREETGAVAGKLSYLGAIDTSPALINERIHLFAAEELTFTERELDDDEFLDVERIHLSELYRMVMSGQIADAKTQIAVLKAAALHPEFLGEKT